MQKRFLVSALVGALVATFSFNSLAIDPAGHMTEEGILITPLLVTSFQSDDNILNQPGNEIESRVFIIAPTVNFLSEDGINSYELELGLKSAKYDDSPDDDYLTNYMMFDSHTEPSSQSRWDFHLSTRKDIEARGTGVTESFGDLLSDPLEFSLNRFNLTYEYGGLTSQGRVAVNTKYLTKSYDNFKDLTRFRNYESLLFGAAFFYSTNSKSDAFLEVTQDAIRYDLAEVNGSRDSDDTRALLGFQWEVTALTTGSIKVGTQNKKFIDSNREDFDGVSWQVDVEWTPLTYSKILINSSRNAKDPNVEGDYINETVVGVAWEHEWSEKLSSTVGFSSIEEEYSGVVRLDETNLLNVGVIFSALRWIDVSVYLQSVNKESTRPEILFDKNIIGVDFIFSM